MNNSDKKRFSEIMTACGAIFRQEVEIPVIKVFWQSLEEFEINEVDAAFNGYLRVGRFMPTPAEIIARIPRAKLHLDKNEAWALCQRLKSEEDTTIITGQMRDAWAIACPILEAKDKVGARMAFIGAYERLVLENPAVKWEVQGGTNKELKYQRVNEAVQLGRLGSEQLQIHYHGIESIGFGDLSKQLLLKVDTPSREKLRKNWAKVKQNLESIHHEDNAAALRQAERDKAEAHRIEVLSRADEAMSARGVA